MDGGGKLAEQCAQRQWDESFVEELDRLVGELDLRCVGWECRGQPGIDAIRTIFEVQPGGAGMVIDRLYELDRRFRIDVFPLGIPVLDRMHVRAELGLQGQ